MYRALDLAATGDVSFGTGLRQGQHCVESACWVDSPPHSPPLKMATPSAPLKLGMLPLEVLAP